MISAVILAGGKNIRLDMDIPKFDVKVAGKSLIQRQSDWLTNQGIKDIHVALEPGGTGGALKHVLENEKVSDRFVLVNVDDLTNINLKEGLESSDNIIYIQHYKCPFGVIKLKVDGYALFVQKPLIEDYISIGISILNKKDILPLLPDEGDLEYYCYPKMKIKPMFHQGWWKTINDRKQLMEAENFFNMIGDETECLGAELESSLSSQEKGT